MIFCEFIILKFWKQANKSLGLQYFLVATVQILPNFIEIYVQACWQLIIAIILF